MRIGGSARLIRKPATTSGWSASVRRSISRPRSATLNWRSPSVKPIEPIARGPEPRSKRRAIAEVRGVVDRADDVGMGRGQAIGDRAGGVARAVVRRSRSRTGRRARAASPAPPRPAPRGSPPRCGRGRSTTARAARAARDRRRRRRPVAGADRSVMVSPCPRGPTTRSTVGPAASRSVQARSCSSRTISSGSRRTR